MSKPRILVLSRSFSGNNFPGLESRLYEEYTMISKKTKILVISEDVSIKSHDNLTVIKVRKITTPSPIQRFFQVLAYVFVIIKHRNEFDIIFSRLLSPENLATNFIAKKLLGKKLLVNLPGCTKTSKSLRFWIYRIFLKSTFKNAKVIMASSENVIKYYQKSYDKYMSPSKFSVIRPPVNAERFTPFTMQKPQNILLCVARINPVKSIETIINAMPYIIKSTPDVQLKIVGPIQDIKYYNILKDLVSKLKCENCIDFVGPIPNERIKEYYDMTKIFIMTGKEEGQSNATLEAMACGIPVIVTPSGLMPELIQDRVNGFLIDHNLPELLGKKVISLLSDKQYLQKMGDEARNTIELEHANWDMYVDNLITLFDGLMINSKQ